MAPHSALPVALRAARESVQEHIARATEIGIAWQEETVSEVLWVNTRVDGADPPIKVADFNKPEEGKVGADWLWWFVGAGGECFGMLVQAKRLHWTSNGTPTLDLRYKDGVQMAKLGNAARRLGVAAAYAVYLGNVQGRGLACSRDHSADCDPCQRRSLLIVSALKAELYSSDKRDAAGQALQDGVALEDFADPGGEWAPAIYGDMAGLDPALRRFLLEEQPDARRLAQRVYRMIIRPDEIMLSTDVAARPLEIPADAIFQNFPRDKGHFAESYFWHVLRGLRAQPPGYVLNIMNGMPADLDADIEAELGGVVVLTL